MNTYAPPKTVAEFANLLRLYREVEYELSSTVRKLVGTRLLEDLARDPIEISVESLPPGVTLARVTALQARLRVTIHELESRLETLKERSKVPLIQADATWGPMARPRNDTDIELTQLVYGAYVKGSPSPFQVYRTTLHKSLRVVDGASQLLKNASASRAHSGPIRSLPHHKKGQGKKPRLPRIWAVVGSIVIWAPLTAGLITAAVQVIQWVGLNTTTTASVNQVNGHLASAGRDIDAADQEIAEVLTAVDSDSHRYGRAQLPLRVALSSGRVTASDLSQAANDLSSSAPDGVLIPSALLTSASTNLSAVAYNVAALLGKGSSTGFQGMPVPAPYSNIDSLTTPPPPQIQSALERLRKIQRNLSLARDQLAESDRLINKLSQTPGTQSALNKSMFRLLTAGVGGLILTGSMNAGKKAAIRRRRKCI